MVLTNFGPHHSESEIRRWLGKPHFGITLTQAADRLLAAGAVTQRHTDWGLDDGRDCLRDGAYPIVGIERRFCGRPSATHAVVIIEVQSVEVEMLAPSLGLRHTLLISQRLLLPGGLQVRKQGCC